jgi:hypothetical protein
MVRRAAIALDQESAIISPELVRVTAACGMLRKTVTIAKARGEILQDKTTAACLPPFTSSICFTFKTTASPLRELRPTADFSKGLRVCRSRASRVSVPYRGPCGVPPERLHPWFVDF